MPPCTFVNGQEQLLFFDTLDGAPCQPTLIMFGQASAKLDYEKLTEIKECDAVISSARPGRGFYEVSQKNVCQEAKQLP